MKTKHLISMLLVAGTIVPTIGFAQSEMAATFDLLFPDRTIERSPDLAGNRKHSSPATLSRGQEIFANRTISEGTSASDNKLQSQADRSPESYEVVQPGLQPWVAMHYKNRIRKAFEMTKFEEVNKKPIIEVKQEQIRYDRKYRSAKNTLDGERGGKNKLYRQFFQ
ncbi:hypothetical protein K9L27_00480 [Candidatus Gracilibacteria bacterium]|nr:hypothetical protein [Candidatus Gracilibacteria bacterium]